MLIGFTAGKGAAGGTLAVANVGLALAAAGEWVWVLDLDPAGGVLAAYLGADPSFGLWPLARAGLEPTPERLAKQAQVRHRLPLIAGLPRASDAAGIDLIQVARVAAGCARLVLVDAGRLPGAGAPVLEACDRIVVVVAPDPVGILAAEQALVALSQAALGRVFLLVSGTTEAGELAQVGELLSAPVLGGIPWEPDEIRRARCEQRPVAGRARKAFARVAETFMPATRPAQGLRPRMEGLMTDGA